MSSTSASSCMSDWWRRRFCALSRRAFWRSAFAAVQGEAATLLVVGHGCSSDFCCAALLGERFPPALHTGGRVYWPAERGNPADGENQPAPPHVSPSTGCLICACMVAQAGR